MTTFTLNVRGLVPSTGNRTGYAEACALNLRDRLYDMRMGQFAQSDRYEGSNSDPASLHKYVYTHGNPIDGIDPTGRSFLTAEITGNFIRSAVAASLLVAVGAAYVKARYNVGLINGYYDAPNQRNGEGGANISVRSLQLIRENVMRQFGNAPNTVQERLIGEGGFLSALKLSGDREALLNWDIEELFHTGFFTDDDPINDAEHFDYFRTASSTLPGTVSIDGRVYEADEVNYYMYGAMVAAIAARDGMHDFDVETAELKIKAYRALKWDGEGLFQRVAWFRAGLHDRLDLAYETALPNAVVSGIRAGTNLNWHWGMNDELTGVVWSG